MLKKRLFITLFVLLTFSYIALTSSDRASAENDVSAVLRILATADLHGQVTAYNYETNSPIATRGLSKLSTLIKQKKKKVGENNSLLVDVGDFLYDYTSNYFYDNHQDLLQPVMKAMSYMNYDYITLGNHEFDYPWEYLSQQLNLANLSDKVVLSNTIWHDHGENVYAPSAIVTKQLATINNTTISVNVGIIGSTTNSIPSRRGDYVNTIDATNNYDSIIAEANRLKASGEVDLILVLLHGGVGSQTLNKSSENIGYALTLVDSIDAIVTSHTHEAFPDENHPAASYKNVNLKNGTINGKPVVAAASHGRALGIIDLNLSMDADGKIQLDSGKSSLSYVTAAVKEDPVITASFKSYLTTMKASADKSTYKIASGTTYHNYDTVVQDSNLYQLYNNAKIAYGLSYVSTYLPKYENTPVIAATKNLLDNTYPHVLIENSFSEAKIAQVLAESSSARPAGYVNLYEISGKALREWLEYNASNYATEGTPFKNMLSSYTSKNKNTNTLLQENYVYNWSSQYIFDGISYEIDLTKKARYHASGKVISTKNKRITNLTYNGTAISDTQKFILVADSGIPALSFLPDDIYDSIKEVTDNKTGKALTLDYVKNLSAFGDINITADYNWSLKGSENYSFLLGIPTKNIKTASKFNWNKGAATTTTSYTFLEGVIPTNTQKVNVIAAQGRLEKNNKAVPILISATSKNSIKEVRYLSGQIKNTTDSKWKKATLVNKNTFSVTNNGTYTILAIDKKGNRGLSYITVDLYNQDTLESPVLNRLTNRNTQLTGTAVPNTTLHVTIGEDKYTTTVSDKGNFTLNVKAPKAFLEISAYVEGSGKKSATIKAAVRKTGPNAVTLNPIYQGNNRVTGTTDTHTFVYALIWKSIYVGRGQSQLYKDSEYYNPSYTIVETDIVLEETGNFTIALPTLKSNMNVFVFAVDRYGITSKSSVEVPR